MKILLHIARIIIAFAIIAGALNQLNDPVSHGYKMFDYLQFFKQETSFNQSKGSIQIYNGKQKICILPFKPNQLFGKKIMIETQQKSDVTWILLENENEKIHNFSIKLDTPITNLHLESYLNYEQIAKDTIAISPLLTIKKELFKNTVKIGIDLPWLSSVFNYLSHHTNSLGLFISILEMFLGIALLIGWQIRKIMPFLFLGSWLNFLFIGLNAASPVFGYHKLLVFCFLVFFVWIIIFIYKDKKIATWLYGFTPILLVGFILIYISKTGFNISITKNHELHYKQYFSEFVELLPWQIWLKEAILIWFLAILMFKGHEIKPWFSKPFAWKLMLFLGFLSGAIGVYSFLFSPIIDLTIARKGALFFNNKAIDMEFNNASLVFSMKKGEEKIIFEENEKFLKSKHFFSHGYQITAIDKNVNSNNTYCSFIDSKKIDSLDLTKKTILVIAGSPLNSERYANKCKNLGKDWESHKISTLWLGTAEFPFQVSNFMKITDFQAKCICSYNPTIFLIRNNIILRKWTEFNAPSAKDLETILVKNK